VNKLILTLLLAASSGPLSAAWKTTVNDRFGNPLWEVTGLRVVPVLLGCDLIVTAKNVSGIAIPGPYLRAEIHWDDGGSPAEVHWGDGADLKEPGKSIEVSGFLLQTYIHSNGKIKSIDVQRSGSWMSPQEVQEDKKMRDDMAAVDRRHKTECAALYRATIDKAQRDLTVREVQQIAYCTLNHWYSE
jgi:hypothetical protein